MQQTQQHEREGLRVSMRTGDAGKQRKRAEHNNDGSEVAVVGHCVQPVLALLLVADNARAVVVMNMG